MDEAGTPIRLREFEWCEIPSDRLLADGRLNLGAAIERRGGLFNTKLTSKGLRLQALGYVGVIPINEQLVIEVVPRVPVSNLSRLLEVSGKAPEPLVGVTRRYAQAGIIYPSLVAMYADALARSLDQVQAQGLLREYERRETITSMPHGRILVGRAMQRTVARGERHRVPISWFHRTVDNPANRCLRYAVWRLAQYNEQFKDELRRGKYRQTARTLNRCMNELQGIELDLATAFLADPIVTGRQPLPTLRRHYRPALDLALAIIGGRALALEDADSGLEMPSLLIEMSDVFEAYLRNVLAKAAQIDGWGLRVLDGNKHSPAGAGKKNLLDSGVPHEATPDIVVAGGTTRQPDHRLLIEVKYKPAKPIVDRHDLNQTLAYGVSYRTPEVVVAQPRAGGGAVGGIRPLGTLAGMNVSLYVFDLDVEDLEAEERRFIQAIKDRV